MARFAASSRARSSFTRSRAKSAGHGKPVTRLRAPPTGDLIDTVLEHADLRDDMGGGRIMLRLSPDRLAEPKVRKGLDAAAVRRLADLAIIWDEREDALFRVLDGAPPPLAIVERSEPDEDDQFVLTPAALAYIAQSQSRGRR